MSDPLEHRLENRILAAKAEYDRRLTVRRCTLTQAQRVETWLAFLHDIRPMVDLLMRMRADQRSGKRVIYDD